MDRKKIIILCVAIAISACLVTGLFVYYYMSSKERGNEIRLGTGNYDDIAKYMEISDLEKLLKDYSYKEVEDASLISGSLKGMANSLGDPYTIYYTEDEFSNVTANSEGLYVGIGITAEPVSRDSGYLRVRRIYNGGPAQEAEIKQGDVIMAVDGVNIADIDYEGALDLINGPSGSEVTLTVASGGEPKEVKMIRADVEVPSVSYNSLDERVGIIEIRDFGSGSVDQFRAALKALIEEEGAEAVVIDLRGNINGTVKAAIDVLDQIMPQGVLAYSKGNTDERTEYLADGEYNDIPLAVIVNSSSASGAEVFAGAVQEAGRGKVIGVKTYGKAVLQTVQAMPYSGGGVKITTAEYYTPSGQPINIYGITPDEIVDMPEDGSGLSVETDPQVRAALNAVYAELGG